MSPLADLNSSLLDQDSAVTIHLVNTEGKCWEAVYFAPARRLTGQQFKDGFWPLEPRMEGCCRNGPHDGSYCHSFP